MTRQTSRRRGFTLVEVLLATVIAVLLLAALYVAMDTQLRLTQDGRKVVEQGTVVRALFNRMSTDLTPSLGPLGVVPASSSSASGSGASGGTTTTTTTTSDPTSTSLPFYFGLYAGDNQSLTVIVSKVPKVTATDPTYTMQQGVSDLRKISYYLDGENGLVRQESSVIQDENTPAAQPADPSTPNSLPFFQSGVLADEVTDLQFRYFDGTTWQDSWDGTQVGADGVTLLGPPRAIEVTLTVRLNGGKGDNTVTKQHRHVIALPACNGLPTAPTNATTTTTGGS